MQVEMAANGRSYLKPPKNLSGFITFLTSAACEWFLIFLLLIDAMLSFLLTKFARHCGLQIPCILCSRIDHVLGDEKPRFYHNLLCRSHRSELSSLVSCHIHGKLANGHDMCEECLLSFARDSRAYAGMQRLLMCKSGFDIGDCGFQSPLLNMDLFPGSTGMRSCSCCSMPWKLKQKSNKQLWIKSTKNVITKPIIPVPRRLTRQESSKRIRGRFSGSLVSHHEKSGSDPLSHVGYTELKITSDSESEHLFSDDDEGNNIVDEMKKPKVKSKLQHAAEIPPKNTANGRIHHPSEPLFLLLDDGEPHDVKCVDSDAVTRHDPGEKNKQQVDPRTYSSTLPEHVSLDGFSPSNVTNDLVGVSREKCELKFSIAENSSASAPSELMFLVDAPSSFNVVEASTEVTQEKSADSTGAGNIRNLYMNRHEKNLRSVTTTGLCIRNDRVANEVALMNPTYVSLTDVWNPLVRNKEDYASSIEEKHTKKEPERVVEELKKLPTENASAHPVEFSPSDTMPCQGSEFQEINALNCNEVQTIREPFSLERIESCGIESIDGNIVSDIRDESDVVWLKQQIEDDKRCIRALYRELEEERNASTVAANQTMAMITRLQEEKAALHMEALQYLRMMEEQAEYDVEALEKANDLLAEKEKEIQDLEAELEFFWLKFPEESLAGIHLEESFVLKEKTKTLENVSHCNGNDDLNVLDSSMFQEVSNNSKEGIALKHTWLDFEDERSFISQYLQDLEMKLHQIAYNEASLDTPTDTTLDEEESHGKESDINARISGEQESSKRKKDIDLIGLQNEISDLNERLEALEADWNFLEHTFNSLKTGKEGLQFVKEVAHELQQLRKFGMISRF